MDSLPRRYGIGSCLLTVVLIAVMGTSASAQGLFGGLPSFGGIFDRNLDTCGPTKSACGPLTFYVGWGDDRIGTAFGESARDVSLGGTSNPRNWQYPNRGLWVGMTGATHIADRLGILLSGWYLVPSNRSAEEVARNGGGGKSWETKNKWYWLEAALNVDFSAGSVVGGLRYDYNTTSFSNPFNVWGFNPSNAPEADFTFDTFIPFLGVQTGFSNSNGNLAVRVIGFPALFGTVKYQETNLAFAGPNFARIEGSGNYRNGYFLEVFAEYSRRMMGSGQIGVFGRWNAMHGESVFDLEGALPGSAPSTASTNLALDRQNWTFGANFSLEFNLPI
jgi:hypothetical protein